MVSTRDDGVRRSSRSARPPNTLFGSAATVPATPRNDLVTVFLTDRVQSAGQCSPPAEMLRLNTQIQCATPAASQNDLGVLGGDTAGFPNGRRPFDDVVTITLRAVAALGAAPPGVCGS